MTSVFWYLDASGERRGPCEHEDIVRFIRAGAIRRETLVWLTDLNDWRRAAETSEFSGFFGGSVPPSGAPDKPPPLPLEGGPAGYRRPHAGGPSALVPSIPVGGFFGWTLVQVLGTLLIIPAPWAMAGYYRFLVSRIALPDGTALAFAGKGSDVWYFFFAMSALGIAGQFHHAGVITLPLTLILQTYVFRWFCAKLTAGDGRLSLSFKGHMLGLLGWYFLTILAVLSLIGWAWVVAAMARWICRGVHGTHRFESTATGGAILWRSLAAGLGFVFILPIPWIMRWYLSWWVSQISVVETTA